MALTLLPTELLLMIENSLKSKGDVNSLICTCRRFALLFNDKLYKDNSASDHARVILWAAERDVVSTIRKCLDAGAKIRRRDRFISHLRYRDEPEVMKVIPRNPKSHPLVAAAQARSMSCVKFLLTYGVLPNYLDENYETPMKQAAGYGHVDIVELLLYITPHAFDGTFKLRRPLKFAAARGQLSVVKTLFKYLEERDRGLTSKFAAQIILYEGLWHCNPDIVNYALEKGADVNDQNPEAVLRFAPDLGPADSPLKPRPRLVQGYKSSELIRGVRTPGWLYDIPNVLHAAVLGKDPGLIKLVMNHGFDFSRCGPGGLRLAIMRKDLGVILGLIAAGVTLEDVDNNHGPLQAKYLKRILRELEIAPGPD
ncbi:hypothetical protein N7475_005018 [Penicillium sp. IBT 31633x]|nr:hypothetical protein N7475_005018 [Penicillium sp. IBT 31633x]